MASATLQDRAALEQTLNELEVLTERARLHLREVRAVNKAREEEARRNYFSFIDRRDAARRKVSNAST